ADNNYSFSYTDGTLTVNKATLIASGEDKTKVYGDANPPLTITYSGFVSGDDATVLDTEPAASTAADETSDAGSYDITVSGGADNNYSFSYTDGTLTVNKATLTATADDKTKICGEAIPELTITYSGFVNSDDVTELDNKPVVNTTADASSDKGSYDIIVSGGDDNNYDFIYTHGILTVRNNLPVIESSPEETTKVGFEYSYQVIATDPDEVQTLIYSTDQLPFWLSFDEQTNTLSGTPMSAELGEYEINITVDDGFDQVSQTYTLLVTGGGLRDNIHPDIKRPEAFSPNGDGYNDHFIIEGLENYPDNSLFIYNRWGNKVFQATPYKNDWDGQSSVAMTFGKDLPSGTYYYILDLGDGSDIIKGYVYIQK
ncbi:MAG: MBG domain-containing protein, partial [Bacteroidales bacterium]